MIDRINQRIEDLTGLEVDTAEELQVKSWLAEGCVLNKFLLFSHFLAYDWIYYFYFVYSS